MKTEKRILRQVAIVLAILLAARASVAADTCTPVRPVGLSAEAVDQLVLRKVAEAVRVPTVQIDTRKTISQLDPTDNVPVTYAFVVVGIEEALAIDSASIFDEDAKAAGKGSPWEGITVSKMQTLARKAYLAGTDTPPPLAPSGATFKTRRFSVAVPSQPANWSLVTCNHDQFAFRLLDASNELYSAAARDIDLEPFKDEESFLAQVKAAAMSSWPPAGFTMKSTQLQMLKGPGSPCALISAEAIPTSPLAPTFGSSRLTLYARFCYDAAAYPHLGYAAMLSHVGQEPADAVRKIAMSFIDGVKAAR